MAARDRREVGGEGARHIGVPFVRGKAPLRRRLPATPQGTKARWQAVMPGPTAGHPFGLIEPALPAAPPGEGNGNRQVG